MKYEVFAYLEEILHTRDIAKRFELFENFYALFQAHKLHFNHSHPISPITTPIYQGICQILPLKNLTHHKTINTDIAMAHFLHSIAHIEYSAIDLALDASYRFRNLPLEFYANWLEVANEEIQHFQSLNHLLYKIGFTYGDFPVHSSLFEAMKATLEFADRMALVHRGMEAGGLDANPFVVKKVSLCNHHLKEQIFPVLQTILQDEISHVSKGNKWWKYSNDPRKFEEILSLYHYKPAKQLNIEARLQSGFTIQEIQRLQAL